MNVTGILKRLGRTYSSNMLGSDIDGEAAGDQSGYSVSMNSAGDRVAIGAINNDGNGSNSGHVRVYSWNGTAWTQLGSDINGEVAGDQSGFSVSMNSAGDRVAIGATINDAGNANTDNRGHVRVYSWNGSAWTQLGSDINGEAAGDYSGYSVSMNSAGDRVAIGAVNNDGNGSNSGHVRVYSLSGTTWTQLGVVDINGEAASDQSGWSVSMNSAGDRVAIGSIYNNSSRGHVRVYSWDGSTWTQLGSDIDGEASGDQSGYSVSMNSAGDRVAVGATNNDGNGSNSGHVRVYSLNGTEWTQLGSDIDGENMEDLFGYSVSMNSAGDRVAVGAIYNDASSAAAHLNYNRGHVRIYLWNGTRWIQLISDIDSEATFPLADQSGWSVSLNSAGDRVAIGAPFNDAGRAGTDNRGHVRVFWNSELIWTQLGSDIDGEATSDNSGYSVSMNSAGDRVAIGAIYNDGTTSLSADNRGHVKVYSWNGSAWTQLGSDIDGEATSDNSGYSVSMNSAGDRVAIGAIYNDGTTSLSADNRGHVKVYSWDGSTWTQLGSDIDGEASGDQSGYSVSMNSAGDRVAIGAVNNDGNGSNSGHVRVYSWDGSAWTQLGVDIDGEGYMTYSGWSVSMNSAGDRVAIGTRYSGANGTNSGHVKVYSWNGSAWIILGSVIVGEVAGAQSGFSVSMNSAGDRVAIGAIGANGANGNGSGHVRVYSWNGSVWTQLGSDIDGEAVSDQLGWSVSLNSAGDRVAIGAINNDGNGSNSGHVRVYNTEII